MRSPPMPSAFDVVVVAPLANPFLLTWRPPGPRRNQPVVVGSGYSQVKSPTSMPMQTGYSMHSGDQTPNPQPVGVWHHVSISARETLHPVGTTIEGLNLIGLPDIGIPSSMLKARIRLALGNGRERSFDFDVGAGVEFKVRAYGVYGIDALVPDPEGGGAIPEDVEANPRALATFLTTAVYCGVSNSHEKNPLTYSQAFELEDNSAFMPVVAGARQVQVFSDQEGPITIEFLYAFGNPLSPSYTIPTDSAIISYFQIPAGETNSPIVFIPGNANAIAVRTAPGTTRLNIVQILNV